MPLASAIRTVTEESSVGTFGRTSRAVVAAGLALALSAASGQATEPSDDPFDVLEQDAGAPDPQRPWIGWYGPFTDGLVDLRFGMDRFTALRVARDRGLDGQPARDGELRFEGEFLGERAELRLTFTMPETDDDGAPIDDGIRRGQLRRIQITWSLFGLPHKPLKLFEQLDGLMAKRYGEPVLSEDDGFSALDVGDGVVRSVYFGREARAQVEVQAYRPERYYVVIALENPQLSGEGEY